jgi:hypothetical protein
MRILETILISNIYKEVIIFLLDIFYIIYIKTRNITKILNF